MAQGFSVGGEYTGASIFVADTPLTVNVALWAAGWTSVLLPGLCWVRGVVVLISTIVGEANFLDWGWRIPFLYRFCR
ncbi:proline/glycine betaine transporter [Escherichia coli]|nr:proline/glycine betaine transporter [Escherichia coli]